MAFVANGDEEEQQQGQGPVSPTGGAVHLSPTSGVGTTAPGGSSAAPANPNAGGQFATLNTYLNANQGQAAPLANKITGQIGQQYNSLDQANQGVLQGIQGQVTNAPGYTASDNALIAQESAAPVSFANDQGNVAKFQKQLTDTYSGPTAAENDTGYQGQQAAVNNAIAQGQANTTTEAGRQNLIQQNSAVPTQGVAALNSAILSKDPTYLGQVESAYKPFQNLVTGLSTGAQGIDKTIASEQADAANAVSNSTGAISGQITGLNSAVNNQLTTAQQTAATNNAAVKDALTTGTASPAALSALGLSQDQWNTLTADQKAAATSQYVQTQDQKFGANSGTANIDLNQFNTQADPNAVFNAANVATPEQYQQAGAFQTLLNGLNLGTPQAVINSSTASQAGTAPTSTNAFDYGNAIGTTTGTTQAEVAAANAYVTALEQGADEAHAQAQAANAQKNFNAASAVLPGITGSIPATVQGTQNLISHPSLKNLGSSLENVFNAENLSAKAGLNTVVNTVKNIFCFHPWTQVEMGNGDTKAICDIQIGEMTKGGKVFATTRGVGTGFYWYEGVLVTGKHAVKEDGTWVRVEDSTKARKFPYLTEVVCNLVTEDHRIWSHGVEFADEHETDSYESLDLDESLAEMNKNVPIR